MEILGFQRALQLADRPAHPHFIVIQLNLLDQQPQVRLAEGRRALAQAFAQQAAEGFDLFRCHGGNSTRQLTLQAVDGFLNGRHAAPRLLEAILQTGIVEG